MKAAVYLRLALSLVVVQAVTWVATRPIFFAETISSTFLAIALLSLFVILLRTQLSGREIAGVGGLAVVLAVLDLHFFGYRASWQAGASFLGIASFEVLALRVIWREGPARRTAIFTVVPAFLFVASEWCADFFLAWTQHAHPKVLDLYLYSFDASMRVQIPFIVGRMFVRWVPFQIVSLVFYVGLPVAIGLTFAGCLVRDRQNALSAFLAFLLTGPVGAFFYNLFPALGPIHIFKQEFPFQPLTTAQASRLLLEAVPAEGARNAIPSLHAAWIFLVLWYSRKLSAGEKVIAGLFVFFTLCATVGFGEHYFIDLVVAVPFSVFMLALANLLAGRKREALYYPLLVGLGGTVAWLAALRFANRVFWISPAIPWLACLLTGLVCFYGLKSLWGPPVVAGTSPAGRKASCVRPSQQMNDLAS